MERIAITGISGYVGSRLLSRLDRLDTVERVVGIDARPPNSSSPKLKFYCRDVCEPLADILVDNRVTCAIHLVFVLRPTHDKKHAHRVDIGGAQNFLEACRQAQVKHIVYLSSHTVYGAHPNSPIALTEDSPLRPLPGFQYSWDKAEAERLLGAFAASHPDVSVTTLRSCPVIGPNAGNSVVSLMFKPVIIAIAGYDPPMQFVHEDDLAEAAVTLIGRNRAGIFNVAGGGDLRYSEVAKLSGRRMVALPERLLRLSMGLSWTLRLQRQSPPSGLEFIKYPPLLSTEKLRRELGFSLSHSSRDALMSFVSPKPLKP